MRVCIVPTCKSGYNKGQRSLSLFKVPENLRHLWKAAITSRKKFPKMFFVCERHFRHNEVLWFLEKRDVNGKILLRERFKRPKLCKDAVPSIFNEENQALQLEEHSVPIEIEIDPGEMGHIDQTESNKNVSGPDRPDEPDIHEFNEVLIQQTEESTENESAIEHNNIIQQIGKSTETESVIVPNNIIQQTEESTETESVIVPNNIIQQTEESTEIESVIVPAMIRVSNSSCNIDSSDETLQMPKSWNVNESSGINGKQVYFINSKVKIVNNVPTPVCNKMILMDCNGKLTYFVRGRILDTNNFQQFTSVLRDFKFLPEILENFEKKGLCIGVAGDFPDNVKEDGAFIDIFNNWHHSKCTLLSSVKICCPCNKFLKSLVRKKRKTINQAIRRMRNVTNKDAEARIEYYKKMNNENLNCIL